ncbi:UNVERIFIED_CONTAM: putative callose synthase 8 [Sesamum radiatum]|uniref:Callose synthase 8 n=1 Tax=Sesamum radiatum TaxID=300843 RepID=A0AAW2KL89_SESRA
MSEIVVAEPTNDEQNVASTSSRRAYTTTDKRPFTRSLTSGREHVPEPFDSEKLPITLVSEIQRFLRVANQIELMSRGLLICFLGVCGVLDGFQCINP